MSTGIDALQKQFELLRGSLPALKEKGATDDQLDAIRNAIAQSRDNLDKAIQGALHEDDPEVAALTNQMNTIQTTIEEEVKSLENIANILNNITKAINIGSQLAAKAVAL